MRRVTRKYIGVLLGVAVLVSAFLPSLPAGTQTARAQDGGRYYPQTGLILAPEFLDFYDTRGGLALFGYPITPARMENGYLVQWTERQRLEWHPENAGTPFDVEIGLLGRELTQGFDGPRFSPRTGGPSGSQNNMVASEDDPTQTISLPTPNPPDNNNSVFFQETGHALSGAFLQYWKDHGGLEIFGYPISEIYTDSTGLQIQWFERARFEYHPEFSADNQVLLGLVGHEALQQQNETYYQYGVYDVAAQESGLQVGVSQGGESTDPHFFDNVKDEAQALGPGLVRMDNVFSSYGIVSRDATGALQYDWSRFDEVIDGIRAMGKEPLLCLSYMPEVISVSGSSRVEPPANYADWGALVAATVKHLNVDRKLGVQYWEVWNEPDQDTFWNAPYVDYMRLYDVTVQSALAVDPTIQIGGPAVAHFSPDHFRDFLKHEAYLPGGTGRVDFLSWHEYGQTPDELAQHIRDARSILEEFPQFSPKLFVTEFNVLQGGSGDTSANHSTDKVDGAIALMRSIEAMQRERLDRAFLFELKDGQGPTDFWGRWGILTNAGNPKPIYYALKAYQNRPAGQLPIIAQKGPDDGAVGVVAYGNPSKATIILWYTGANQARIKLDLGASFANAYFNLTLFDSQHNNPAKSGDNSLQIWGTPRDAGDLVMDLQPNSLVVLTSR